MIKIFILSLGYLAISIAATTIWVNVVLTKRANDQGRDPDYYQFEVVQNAMCEMHDDLSSNDRSDRQGVVIGFCIGVAMVLLWPITTPAMMYVGTKYNDEVCEILGW